MAPPFPEYLHLWKQLTLNEALPRYMEIEWTIELHNYLSKMSRDMHFEGKFRHRQEVKSQSQGPSAVATRLPYFYFVYIRCLARKR